MKISIVLASYNGSSYLRDQISSFFSQTQLPNELIIVDDCSNDNSIKILNEIKAKSPFEIKIFQNSQNIGSTKTFELAIEKSSGDFIFFSDQDDVWCNTKIERFMEEFRKKSDVGLVCSNATLVDNSLGSLGISLWSQIGLDLKIQNELVSDGAFENFLRKFWVTGATMAIRKSILEGLLPIPSNWVHDAWLSTIISATSKISFLPEQLVFYRQHDKQQIGALKKNFFFRLYKVFIKHNDFLKLEYERLLQLDFFLRKLQFEGKVEKIRFLKAKIAFQKKRIEALKGYFFSRLIILLPTFLKKHYSYFCANKGIFICDLFSR